MIREFDMKVSYWNGKYTNSFVNGVPKKVKKLVEVEDVYIKPNNDVIVVIRKKEIKLVAPCRLEYSGRSLKPRECALFNSWNVMLPLITYDD